MKTTFSIDTENNITALAEGAAAADGSLAFASANELAKAAAEWPIERLVETWNGFAGAPPFGDLKPVKKFTDRKTAVARIWKAIQTLGEDLLRASIRDAEAKLKATRALTPTPAPQAAPVAPAPAKATKAAKPAKKQPKAAPAAKKADPKAPRADSKKAEVIKMLQRKNGASNQEIQKATDWQPHTVRGFIAGTLKKAGLVAESFKTDAGERRYRLA
jgi:hypothetical protein